MVFKVTMVVTDQPVDNSIPHPSDVKAHGEQEQVCSPSKNQEKRGLACGMHRTISISKLTMSQQELCKCP